MTVTMLTSRESLDYRFGGVVNLSSLVLLWSLFALILQDVIDSGLLNLHGSELVALLW